MLVEGYKLYNYMCQSNLLRMCKFLACNTYLQNPKHPMSLMRQKDFCFWWKGEPDGALTFAPPPSWTL
jgi:hypothetical protein